MVIVNSGEIFKIFKQVILENVCRANCPVFTSFTTTKALRTKGVKKTWLKVMEAIIPSFRKLAMDYVANVVWLTFGRTCYLNFALLINWQELLDGC